MRYLWHLYEILYIQINVHILYTYNIFYKFAISNFFVHVLMFDSFHFNLSTLHSIKHYSKSYYFRLISQKLEKTHILNNNNWCDTTLGLHTVLFRFIFPFLFGYSLCLQLYEFFLIFRHLQFIEFSAKFIKSFVIHFFAPFSNNSLDFQAKLI